jgi:endonuclease/exonuclease/phosphatase family metal-dependent hydrolase
VLRIPTILFLAIAAILPAPSVFCDPEEPELKVLCWNIWRAGIKKEESDKPHQVAALIKKESPDLVAMQETYGSGPWLKEQLGYHLQLRGPHLSIFSKHPIRKDLSVGGEWHCTGALIDVPDVGPVAFFSIWLPYAYEIWAVGTRTGRPDEELIKACDPSRATLATLLTAIDTKLRDESLEAIPVLIAGDFNSMSHLDYTKENATQFDGRVIAWPTSLLMTEAGYTDVYRSLNPEVDRKKDRTWSPEFPEQSQDRIDFIYLRSQTVQAKRSWVVDDHEPFFPSDHAALMATFELGEN